VATLREVCGRAFGPVALPPPGGLGGLAADELERLWATLAAAPVATAVVGPDGRFLKVNAALCALVGHPEAALLAAGYQAVVHPEDRDADLEQLQRRSPGRRPATSSSSAADGSTGRRSRCCATPGW
jgi:PAS domain S-box-containing protein